jgi:hypothetical protein
MKIYVSGPINGRVEGNLAAFCVAQGEITELGHTAVIPHNCPPHEHVGECPQGYATPFAADYPEHTSTACFIRGDFEELLTCDAIYMLPGWERSVGARGEFDVAALAGLEIYYQDAPGVPRA